MHTRTRLEAKKAELFSQLCLLPGNRARRRLEIKGEKFRLIRHPAAAVDVDGLARQPLALVGGEENHDRGDVVIRVAGAVERVVAESRHRIFLHFGQLDRKSVV